MKILSIDPGTTRTAMMCWDTDTETIDAMRLSDNDAVIKSLAYHIGNHAFDAIVFEGMFPMGMPLGRSTIKTCYFIGKILRIADVHGFEPIEVKRMDVKMHHCNNPRAKDSNIRQALIDRYGEPGKKANPGILFGVKADLWSALAIAVYYMDTKGES